MGYEGDLGVKRKVLKFSTTLSTVKKFIKAIKMPKNDDEQELRSLTGFLNLKEIKFENLRNYSN